MDIKKIFEQHKAHMGISDSPEALAKVDESDINSFQPTDVPTLRMPEAPTQEKINEDQNASAFMKALAESVLEWKNNLPDGYAVAIEGILYGGVQIQVNKLSQVSFHDIKIEGTLNGSPCMMLAHQSTVQVLCVAKEVSPENPQNPITFVWQNHHVEV